MSDFSDYVNHLEFLGYEVSEKEGRIMARHSEHFNLTMKRYRGGMLATIYIGTNDYAKRNREGLVTVANRLNTEAAAGRYYIDSDGDIVIEGYYPGEYNRKSFSIFMETFNFERSNMLKVADELRKYVE